MRKTPLAKFLVRRRQKRCNPRNENLGRPKLTLYSKGLLDFPKAPCVEAKGLDFPKAYCVEAKGLACGTNPPPVKPPCIGAKGLSVPTPNGLSVAASNDGSGRLPFSSGL